MLIVLLIIIILLPPNSQDLEQPAPLELLQVPLLRYLKTAGSTLPTQPPNVNPHLQHTPLCEVWVPKASTELFKILMLCAERKKAANGLLWSICTVSFLTHSVISLKLFALKNFWAIKDCLMLNLHVCALFWLLYDFVHSTFLHHHEYIQIWGYLLHNEDLIF